MTLGPAVMSLIAFWLHTLIAVPKHTCTPPDDRHLFFACVFVNTPHHYGPTLPRNRPGAPHFVPQSLINFPSVFSKTSPHFLVKSRRFVVYFEAFFVHKFNHSPPSARAQPDSVKMKM